MTERLASSSLSTEEHDEDEEDDNAEESEEESQEELVECSIPAPTRPPFNLIPPPPVWVQRNQGLSEFAVCTNTLLFTKTETLDCVS